MTDIVFSAQGGTITLTADFESNTIWANQEQIASIFDVSIPEVVRSMAKIFADDEHTRENVTETRNANGKIDDYYNLDMIVSIGYKLDSKKATQFRKWAATQLAELITTGLVIDDNRFAKSQLAAFQKLVDRVRSIRTSERHFYQKITDIFTTSSDYDKNSKVADKFFSTIQNKFHYAIHANTAAEVIYSRANSDKIQMGLTHTKNNEVSLADARVAKNYLTELEAKKLELLSEQFLSYAELKYYDKKEMTMKEWEEKLNDFLRFNEKKILIGNGKVSRNDALLKASSEHKKYQAKKISAKK